MGCEFNMDGQAKQDRGGGLFGAILGDSESHPEYPVYPC